MFSVFSRFLAVFQVQEVDRKVEEIKVPILPARRYVFLLLRSRNGSFISKGLVFTYIYGYIYIYIYMALYI